jgi:hypothetical protein
VSDVEFFGIVGVTVAVISAFVGSFFFGGRRWRVNYDAEHTRAERMQATLVEKDQILDGQSERLRRLDEVVQELGGERVAQKIIEAQAENLRAFKEISEALANHELRASDRHKAQLVAMKEGYDHLATVNQDGFEHLARAFREGRGKHVE